MRRTAMFFVVCSISIAVFSAGCNRNEPPATPQLNGPSSGSPGETLTFTVSATDPEDQELEYMVAWGDTSAVEWSPLYPSGQQVTRTHVYRDTGVFQVRAKARDAKEAESGWSLILNVVVVSPRGGPPTGVAVSAGPGG